MNTYFQYLTSTLADRYLVEVEYSANKVTLLCRDLAGNLVTTRVFTDRQLKNAPLMSLVLTDLKATLLKADRQPVLTPLPESAYPCAL